MNNTDKQFMFEFNFHEYGSIDAKDYEKEKKLLLIELAKLQQWVIKNKRKIAVVFEGRDLGTVVFPHAQLKFFLTAQPETRAKRRYRELIQKFPDQVFSYETILKEIKERDAYDSEREHAPLKQAEDAISIDTSDLSIEEVTDKLKSIYLEKKR